MPQDMYGRPAASLLGNWPAAADPPPQASEVARVRLRLRALALAAAKTPAEVKVATVDHERAAIEFAGYVSNGVLPPP
jgi:hypothetical protein